MASSVSRRGRSRRGEAEGDRGITTGYGFVIAVVVVAVLLAWNGVKIVREYERLVVFRLGRGFGPRGPGIVYLIPIIDTAVCVDLLEAFLEIPAQTCITKDNAPISIDFLIYWKVFDPQLSVPTGLA